MLRTGEGCGDAGESSVTETRKEHNAEARAPRGIVCSFLVSVTRGVLEEKYAAGSNRRHRHARESRARETGGGVQVETESIGGYLAANSSQLERTVCP